MKPNKLTEYKISLWNPNTSIIDNCNNLKISYDQAQMMIFNHKLKFTRDVKPLWKKCPCCGNEKKVMVKNETN